MGMAIQQLIESGALKGNADEFLKDYTVDEATNYINITIPQSALGLTNELEVVGAATCPTYKVATDMLQYIDAIDGQLKTFSAATINERLRIAMRTPKVRFRYVIMDYKRFFKQKESQLKKNPELAQKLRNMFLTDVMGMFTEVLPQIEDGKQLATLVGTSQVTPKLNKVARELSMAYRKALKMEKTSGQINKSYYTRLKKSYTEFMNELLEQVFPGLEYEQKEESRRYSYCKDGRIDLYAEPTTEQIEREAEDEVLDEETRALNEDLNHFEEESQKEYSNNLELGENIYYIAKFVPQEDNLMHYYYDLISELNPIYDKLMKIKVNQSIKFDGFIITKLTDDIQFEEALKWMKKQGIKSFSDDGMTEVTFRTTNPEQLTKIVNAIGECGNGGHSFEIVIDPDSTKEEGGNIRFGWDGDGSDRVEISDKTFSASRKDLEKEARRLFKILDPKLDKTSLDKVIDFGFGLAANPQDLITSLKERLDDLGKSYSTTFSEEREKVSAEMLEKAKTDGVVQKKPNGSWGIISIDAGEWWTPDYESEEKAKNALEAYHANKFEE
jgi:hypothetical protein